MVTMLMAVHDYLRISRDVGRFLDEIATQKQCCRFRDTVKFRHDLLDKPGNYNITEN